MPWSSSTARSERERAAVRHVADPVLSNGPVASSRTHGGSGDVHAEDPLDFGVSHRLGDIRMHVAVGQSVFETRSVYRDGLGCLNMNGTQAPDAPSRASIEADGPVPVLLPEIAGAAVVDPDRPGLKQALDAAFAEPADGPQK